jgi:hypothetical protein
VASLGEQSLAIIEAGLHIVCAFGSLGLRLRANAAMRGEIQTTDF